jgi:hypothetical protein
MLVSVAWNMRPQTVARKQKIAIHAAVTVEAAVLSEAARSSYPLAWQA